jgi:putative membrane protein insertion efficiency factor
MIALLPAVFAAALKAAAGAAPSRRGVRAADPAAPVPDGVVAAGLYGAVRYYRARVSPRRAPCCPYTPSCSTYAVQALHRHGALRGARLTAGRLLRCRPGTAGGADPVPPR